MVRRLLVFVAVVLVVAGTAEAGAWFVPFMIGLVAGGLRGVVPPGASRAAGAAASRYSFPSVPLAALAAILGWTVPLWAMALAGLPAGATARVIAGLAGLPPYAAVAIAVTLLLAALQVLAGAWLARAVLPAK
jgi:hypothetical protein